ncbi:hypothetical protein M885DRAFT_524895 [Pelagophyceae sp. CCMP2097]|nr:hypothetical protein M885DRAFT_524895 [Pelagophyceae sp. CCMP2097]
MLGEVVEPPSNMKKKLLAPAALAVTIVVLLGLSQSSLIGHVVSLHSPVRLCEKDAGSSRACDLARSAHGALESALEDSSESIRARLKLSLGMSPHAGLVQAMPGSAPPLAAAAPLAAAPPPVVRPNESAWRNATPAAAAPDDDDGAGSLPIEVAERMHLEPVVEAMVEAAVHKAAVEARFEAAIQKAAVEAAVQKAAVEAAVIKATAKEAAPIEAAPIEAAPEAAPHDAEAGAATVPLALAGAPVPPVPAPEVSPEDAAAAIALARRAALAAAWKNSTAKSYLSTLRAAAELKALKAAAAPPAAPHVPSGIGVADQHVRLAALKMREGLDAHSDFDAVHKRMVQETKHLAFDGASNYKARMALCRSNVRRLAKTFFTSSRKDFVHFVNEELVGLGLCPTRHTPKREKDVAQGIDFYMGEQFESEMAPTDLRWAHHYSPAFNAGSIIGAMPGLMALFGTKDSYAKLWWRCKDLARTNDAKAMLCPESWLMAFNVDGDDDPQSPHFKSRRIVDSNVRQYERVFNILNSKAQSNPLNFPLWWIVKPQKGAYLSRGMHISKMPLAAVSSKDRFKKWISAQLIDQSCRKKYDRTRCDRRRVSFQQYNSKPLLAFGRKFDVRLWLVITALDPLRVYILRHGYPKISSRDWDETKDQDQCIHIRMMLDPICNESTMPDVFFKPFEYGYPKSTASPVLHAGLDFKTLRSDSAAADPLWPDQEDVFSSVVWPQVEDTFTKVMMLTRGSLLKSEAAARSAAAAMHKGPATQAAPHRRFSLLSPDVTLDENGKVYVEEINTNGMIMGTHARHGGYRDLFHDEGYITHFLSLLGADDWPKQHGYSEKLEVALEHFCAARTEECSFAAKEAIRATVHEEAHAGPDWYRLYPPLHCLRGEACVGDRQWPEQAKVTDLMRAAMRETSLDVALRQFLDAVDTEAIHGKPQVPGHARWAPRAFKGQYAP